METVNLCKCLNCESILIDENPQVNANKYNLVDYPESKDMYHGEDPDGYFTGCPECKTDSYLIDL